ncbi:MAG: BrnT family toxin [Thermomicrobiales bacterium]
MRFEWDEDKARSNLAKHGVPFPIAELIFYDPLRVTMMDTGDHHEVRWQSIGTLPTGLTLFVVHTERSDRDGTPISRIISARRATRAERRRLEEGT